MQDVLAGLALVPSAVPFLTPVSPAEGWHHPQSWHRDLSSLPALPWRGESGNSGGMQCWGMCYSSRMTITGCFGLEKPSQGHSCPQMPHLQAFKIPQEWEFQHSPVPTAECQQGCSIFIPLVGFRWKFGTVGTSQSPVPLLPLGKRSQECHGGALSLPFPSLLQVIQRLQYKSSLLKPR